jgi:ferredoxin-NADP reductase
VWQFDTEFAEIIQRTPEVKSFRLPIHKEDIYYKAGQFFFLTIKIKGVDAVHPFSFSSSPSDNGYIEFTKRITDHDFSQALDNVKPRTWSHITGPFGNFTLPSRMQPLAFLAGGIGITPMRSMLRYIAYHKLFYNIVLLYGNKSREEIAFYQGLDELASSIPSIHVQHVLSGPIFPNNWKGKRGFINKDLVIETIPDYKERLFYVSGPPKMVLSLVKQLIAIKIPEKRIKRDSFTGYD